ncbi:MAG TPA: acetyl-CoA carboxylase biotin carboxyl carrier protein [Pyrinomonadaceae bacterium]|jgi:acetyl-CoA carboxylase biotin carboxyl carrier protein
MSENTGSARAQEENKQSRHRSRKKSGNREAQPSLNMSELRELAELVNEHGFTDFEFENANIRVRLSKMTSSPIVHQMLQQPAATAPASAPPTSTAETQAASAETAVEAKEDLYTIPSPIVGTFYRSPSPDKEPYVKEGSKVMPETVVCIVEAMKLMNEIQAETSGEVVEIYIENGQPVEYGQPLFGIRK